MEFNSVPAVIVGQAAHMLWREDETPERNHTGVKAFSSATGKEVPCAASFVSMA
jgi:hypothetical protein